MGENPKRPLLGWRERVDLPEWGLRGVRAKIDTGARTSAIDVAKIEYLDDGRIRFEAVAKVSPVRKTRHVTAMPIRVSRVKSSNGHLQERIVCRTRMVIGEHEQDIEISLVCRKNMLCRMLVGRSALADHFHVDPGSMYVQTSRTRPPSKNSSAAKQSDQHTQPQKDQS